MSNLEHLQDVVNYRRILLKEAEEELQSHIDDNVLTLLSLVVILRKRMDFAPEANVIIEYQGKVGVRNFGETHTSILLMPEYVYPITVTRLLDKLDFFLSKRESARHPSTRLEYCNQAGTRFMLANDYRIDENQDIILSVHE